MWSRGLLSVAGAPEGPLIDGKIPFSPPLWRETLSRQAPRTWASSTMTRVFLAT